MAETLSPHDAEGRNDVSVIIPHYGDPEPTLKLIAMLRRQRDVRTQVIVCDDASPSPFPAMERTEVVVRTTNGGFGSAVNSGAEMAAHDLILILNSDIEINDTFVRDLVDAASGWQPCVAGPHVVNHAGTPDWSGRHFPTVSHQAVEWLTPLARFRERRSLHEAVGHDTLCVAGAVRPTDWLVGAALLIPTAAFKALGGFDERFYMNSEEVDLQRRLRELDIPSIYVGTVSVIHEGGGSSDPARRRQWLMAGRMMYADKWGGKRRLQGALAAATVANLVANTARRLAGRDLHPLNVATYEFSLIRGRR